MGCQFCFVKKPEKEAEKSEVRSFSAIVRDCDLWNPRNFNNHSEWISTLTSTIIDCGVIKDEVLQCLSQMCQVHVSVLIKGLLADL